MEQSGALTPDLDHPLCDGLLVTAPLEWVGQQGDHAQKAQERLAGGIRLVVYPETDRRNVFEGRDVPELGFGACLRGWFIKSFFQFLLEAYSVGICVHFRESIL